MWCWIISATASSMSISTSPVTSGRDACTPAPPSGSTPSATTASARSRSVMTPTGRPPSQMTTEPTLRSRMRPPTARRLSAASAVTTPSVITSLMRTSRLYRVYAGPRPLPLAPGRVGNAGMETRGKQSAIVAACVAVVAAWLVLAAPASASSDMETVLQDDPNIVYQDDGARLDENLEKIASLGVDTIRVSLYWHLVAPNPTRKRHPDFGEAGAADPASYSQDRWRRYDRIVKLAGKHGLNVYFSITGPAPRWATRSRTRNINNDRPNPRDFRDFVTAVGRRSSGSYPDPDAAPPPDPAPTTPSLPVSTDPPESQPVIPRVARWSFWNEPNFPSWLGPQWKRVGRRAYRPISPTLYRRLVDAGWLGLQGTTHAGDVILLGETAPYGPHDPKRPGVKGLMAAPMFLRELYCVNKRYRPYRGRAARVRACPTTAASRRRFRATHPALFEATGWAHHAYSLQRPPTFKGRRRDAAPLGALYRLTRALDRSQFRWGAESAEWPIWITEYGYQTLPPDPYRGVSWGRQASWMSWGEYLAYRNPRVDSYAQFLLVDDAPKKGLRRRDKRRWVTWQSGFITLGGQIKPSMDEFRRPIHVTPARAHRGRSARVFGLLRTAPYDTPIDARIEFARSGGPWQALASTTVTNARGYLLQRVRPPGTGRIRIVWTDPTSGSAVVSRAQRIVRR